MLRFNSRSYRFLSRIAEICYPPWVGAPHGVKPISESNSLPGVGVVIFIFILFLVIKDAVLVRTSSYWFSSSFCFPLMLYYYLLFTVVTSLGSFSSYFSLFSFLGILLTIGLV
jgi:hypothetical protein